MKPNSYILTYWPRVQKEFRVDLQLLAQCLVDDCPEELEEDGEFICENLYNETWEDLADIIDKLINLE